MKEERDAPTRKPLLKMYARAGLWFAILCSLVWTIAIVAAPLTIPSESVRGLEGRANIIDFREVWATLPPVQSVVYYLGDLECHQIESRTIILNGNQMPVCSRDASLFFFLTFGLILAAVVRPEMAVSKALIGMFPARFRRRLEGGKMPIVFSWFLGMLMLVPIVLDGGLQLLTSYESSNGIRFLTGIPAGAIIGLVIGLLIQSIHLQPSSRRMAQSQ